MGTACRAQRLVTLTLLSALGAWSGTGAQEAEVFYTGLLQEGKQALTRGDNQEVVTRLRVACFGLLDQPSLLAECRVHLAVAQSELGDELAFRDTAEQVLEIEELFGAYRDAELPPGLRSRFEERLLSAVGQERLRAVPVFAALLTQRRRSDLEAVPPATQRSRLRAFAEENPADTEWPLRLAELEIEAGKDKAALTWLDETLSRDPAHEGAHCRRMELLAAKGRCDEILLDVAACPSFPSDAATAKPLLKCFVELEAWPVARRLLLDLGDQIAGDRRLQRLAETVPPPNS